MRRVLTILSAIVLLIVSLGIGALTADLPFWRRALQLPLPDDATYLPVAAIGDASSGTGPATGGDTLVFDTLLVDEAAARARTLGARALLVMHQDRLVIERYFAADDARSLLPAGVISRPVAAMAVGLALADKRIASLDAPVSGWLPEWGDEPRGRITLRQLLEETSGLETGGAIAGLLQRSPWKDTSGLARFATARGVRMVLGNDYESTALGFELEHEPGGFHNPSPANAQLAAVIVERATQTAYEHFVDQHLWSALGAGHAELQLDRRSGMPAAHCCWRATGRDMIELAALLTHDGRRGDRQVLPAGWVAEMSRPSRVSAGTGLQLNLLRLEGIDVLEGADEEGSAFWAVPSRGLTVLCIGSHPDDLGDRRLRDLPALFLRGFATR